MSRRGDGQTGRVSRKHLLVTNDFPPKIGGIQSLLWEWWRRLDPESFAVLTSPHRDAARFDAEAAFEIRRTREPVLLPHPLMVRHINAVAREVGADHVVLDPAVPLGAVGPHLELAYSVVLHGAEVTVPGRLPVSRQLLSRVLRGATAVIAAGGYPAAEAERAAGRALPVTVVPPGVDVGRFVPPDAEARLASRERFGFTPEDRVVLGVSRLVPRKGFDVLIRASANLAPRVAGLRVVIASGGRDEQRLRRLATECAAPVTFLGRVGHDELPDLYGASDVFAMLCRNRWGGLEQEGFGIVFVEAAACGVPQIAGRSGGAAEAVENEVTGFVLDDPTDVGAVEERLERLLTDDALRARMGAASRTRAVEMFDYDVLAAHLGRTLAAL